MIKFDLPPVVAELVQARMSLRSHYQAMLAKQGSEVKLSFTFDGNLVGDIGEALAAQLFGIRLVEAKSTKGIDGRAPDGRTVQVKATVSGRGPAFRCVEPADHLIFFELNLEAATGTVVFNGPEAYARSKLPKDFKNQRSLTAQQIRSADDEVQPSQRLPMLVDQFA